MAALPMVGLSDETRDDSSGRPLILIVDDDPAAVHQLHSLARDLGQVQFCLSGEEALRMVRLRRPDLILLDMELPGISGTDTCRALRRHLERVELPVIFVSAHADPENEALALSIGANDFIAKPFSPLVTRARIETHLALKRRSDELLRLTHTDALTGLANRRLFSLSLEREWKRAVRHGLPLALLMVDVDHFKSYNDTYGHPQGDQCLRQVGEVLGQSARRAGDLVARYGGEEFALLLPHTDAEQAWSFAGQVHGAIAVANIPHFAVAGQVRLTVSVGVSAYSPEETERARSGLPLLAALAAGPGAPESLLNAADLALYQAKAEGRNRSALRAPEAARV